MDNTHDDAAAGDHHLISPTAKLIAFLRSFSDIPNSKQISEDVDGDSTAKELYQEGLDPLTRFCAPLAEARYKCFDRYMHKYRNFMEIAVGTAVERGHRITSENPTRNYVGTDLPGMLEEARSLFGKYYPSRTNHHLIPVNVLSRRQLDAAIDLLGNGEVMVLNEGLWMYLSAQEQLRGAVNIRQILERTGGVWITPDFDDHEHVRSALPPNLRDSIKRATQAFRDLTRRDSTRFLYKDSAEIHQFLRKAGLEADEAPMMDGAMKLASIENLWVDEPYPYGDILKSMRLWIIRPVTS